LTRTELNRNPSTNNQSQHVEAVSSNIDDKTLHELYLWPFQDAVHAGSGNIMCSYNRINNSYGCQNSKLQNGILKDELGFQGFVVSDWGALHAGYAAAEAGLDMVMPNGGNFWGKNLTTAIDNGTMEASVLDNMATRSESLPPMPDFSSYACTESLPLGINSVKIQMIILPQAWDFLVA
tara:strand:+ start:163 stop:699 length:537 start_codon:yes stop_codon:yes gene_type:complete